MKIGSRKSVVRGDVGTDQEEIEFVPISVPAPEPAKEPVGV